MDRRYNIPEDRAPFRPRLPDHIEFEQESEHEQHSKEMLGVMGLALVVAAVVLVISIAVGASL